jgi:hypothetical protein
MDTTTTASKFNEDDSASEYTDPENNSAPTELFAEFLATILQKKWKNALKNCKLSNNFYVSVSLSLSLNCVSIMALHTFY